jgi:hypothetical protein
VSVPTGNHCENHRRRTTTKETDPSADIRSRYYGFAEGETLHYTYEIKGDTLTIWMGERNSPAYYEGTFSQDDRVLTGAWHYPGGGGYSTVSTRSVST